MKMQPKPGQDIGAHLPPCNKIVRVDARTGETVELLPCGGGLVGMGIEQVKRYCGEWFTEKHICSGWLRLHGELPPPSPTVARPVILESPAPTLFTSSPTLAVPDAPSPLPAEWMPAAEHPDFPDYRGVARYAGVGAPAEGLVTAHHVYPETGDVALLIDGAWYMASAVEVPWAEKPAAAPQLVEDHPQSIIGVGSQVWLCSTGDGPYEVCAMHVYEDTGEVIACVRLSTEEEPQWMDLSLLQGHPVVVVAAPEMLLSEEEPALSAAVATPEMPPTAPTFQDLLQSITGRSEPILLQKPDVGEILADMQGLAGGSSLSWGFNIHILADWQQCKRRVYLAHVLGVRTRYPKPHLQIGTLYHAALYFAKAYGVEKHEEPLKFVEEKVGIGVLGEEMAVTRALLRARLKRYGHLDSGPSGEVILAEQRIEAFSEPVKIPGKTGSYRIRLCGRLDDCRRTLMPDGRHGVSIHDEKTSSMLTRELTEGFGLDFQLTGYAALYVQGGYEQTEAVHGPLHSAQVTIAVKPDVSTGGVRAVDPSRDIVRVESPYDRRDILATWHGQMLPSALSLATAMATWERGDVPASGKKAAIVRPNVDMLWPKCTVNCVGRWGRCDYFELCSRHFNSARGVEDIYETLEHRQVRVLGKGAPYFEKVRGAASTRRATPASAASASDASPPASGMETPPGRSLKDVGSEVLAKQILDDLWAVYQSLIGTKMSDGSDAPAPPAWYDEESLALVRQLYAGVDGAGADEGTVRRMLTALLKLYLENTSEGAKEEPMFDTDMPAVNWVLLGADPVSGRAKSPLVCWATGGKWTAIPRNMIMAAAMQQLFAVE